MCMLVIINEFGLVEFAKEESDADFIETDSIGM